MSRARDRADGTVVEGDIAADAVNFATHLKAGTDGELITWDAAANPAAVAVGTSGHVLTSGGINVAPTFQASAVGGSWVKVSQATPSAATSVIFSESSITSTYANYVIIARGITSTSSGANDMIMEVSTDNGSNPVACEGTNEYARFNTAQSDRDNPIYTTNYIRLTGGWDEIFTGTNATQKGFVSVIEFYNLSSATEQKWVKHTTWGVIGSASATTGRVHYGWWTINVPITSTTVVAPVNHIKLLLETTAEPTPTWSAKSVTLYGIAE